MIRPTGFQKDTGRDTILILIYSLFARRINIGSTPARHTVLEAQKIKFRPGSPECFKTLTETKVWTHFLVQAGFRIFGLQLLKTYMFLFIRSKNPHRHKDFEHTYMLQAVSL